MYFINEMQNELKIISTKLKIYANANIYIHHELEQVKIS